MLRSIPGIIISNVSFPKFIENLIIRNSASCKIILPYLLKSIKQLENAGTDFIILPCNTLHALLPILKEQTKLEITDLVEEVSVEARKFKKIGIIGTSKTIDEKLYEHKGFEVIYPAEEEQKELSRIIMKIIRKSNEDFDKEYILKIVNKMKYDGAEKIIFACTDLSNLNIINKDIIDSQKILINSILKRMVE